MEAPPAPAVPDAEPDCRDSEPDDLEDPEAEPDDPVAEAEAALEPDAPETVGMVPETPSDSSAIPLPTDE